LVICVRQRLFAECGKSQGGDTGRLGIIHEIRSARLKPFKRKPAEGGQRLRRALEKKSPAAYP